MMKITQGSPLDDPRLAAAAELPPHRRFLDAASDSVSVYEYAHHPQKY